MSDFLILVNVGSTVTLFNYLNGKPIPKNKPMAVKPGDRIAWNVQVYVGNTPHPLAYQVNFFNADKTTPNSSFFGIAALLVPAGGTSQFLHVLSLQERIKYSISVTGIGTILDPEIQTGEGNLIPTIARVPKSYKVTWNIDDNSMSYQVDGGASTPFPPPPHNIRIFDGDKFSFEATSTVIHPAPDIQVAFVPNPTNRLWASPFFQNHGTIPFLVPINPIPPLPVLDDVDAANATPFTFNIEADNETVMPSDPFILKL